jgi:site-specific recombinase XerD
MNDVLFGVETKLRLVGKGNKSRIIVIPENCARLLEAFIDSEIIDGTDRVSRLKPVFSSQTHEKMSISCVEELVEKYVRQAKAEYPSLFGRSNYTPHSFRHSISVHMLEAGESLAVIRAFLGHSSISSTMVYASVTPELANKYLRERGKVLDKFKLAPKEESIIASLPFLQKIYSRKAGSAQ